MDDYEKALKRVLDMVMDCGEDSKPDSEYRQACNDIAEEIEQMLSFHVAESNS